MQTLFISSEEIPEEFLDETDVDSCFYHNIFDTSQSQHRIVRISKGSNKKSFAIKLFQFCDWKTQQRYILQEEVNISKRKLTCLVDSLRNFLKTFDKACKCIQILLSKPKVEIGSTKSKDNLFAHHYNDIIEHPNRQILLSFRFGNNNPCVFSLKKFELHGNQFILTEIVNLNHRDFQYLYKNRYYVANKWVWKNREQLQGVAHSPLIVALTIALIFSLGTCHGQIQSVQVDYACTKRLFNLSAEAIVNARNVGLCARCALFILEIKQISFSCRLVKGFTFLKRAQNQFKMLLEMSIVLASIVPTERNAKLLEVM